jgi:hypothetical protein
MKEERSSMNQPVILIALDIDRAKYRAHIPSIAGILLETDPLMCG